MTTVMICKLVAANSAAALQTALAALQVSATQLATDQRGQDIAAYFDPTDDLNKYLMAVAYAGDDTPASKVSDQQFLVAEASSLTALQTAVNTALAAAIHHTRSDGNCNANAGDVTVGAAMFQSTDVGRGLIVGTATRTISAYVSSTRVTYSGAAITGTGKTVSLLGAECLQSLEVAAFRERDGDPHYSILLAVEGQLA